MVLLLFCSCGKDESMDSSKGLVVEQQGTKDKVYKIYTAKGFAEFADSMNFRNSTSKSDINVVIMSDIDMSQLPNKESGGNWQPIANRIPTTIRVEGNNHIIKGLKLRYIDGVYNYGLFEEAYISNVKLENTDVNIVIPQNTNFTWFNVGTIIGEGSVSNCSAKSSSINCQVNSNNSYWGVNIGGMLGCGSASNCISDVNITIKNNSTGNVYTGGIAGELNGYGNQSQLYTCGSTNVEGNSIYAGGICGRDGEDNVLVYCSSESKIEVSSGNSYIGGLVGLSGSYIICSYSNGKLVGEQSHVGGLIGTSDYARLICCYTDADLKGKWIGGLIGNVVISPPVELTCASTTKFVDCGEWPSNMWENEREYTNNASKKSIYELLTSKQADNNIHDWYNGSIYPTGRGVCGKSKENCIWLYADNNLKLWWL